MTTLLALVLLALPANALAANQTVRVNDSSYDPATSKINPGDTVTWSWQLTLPVLTQRSVTSDTGLFDSGPQGSGATFSYTFNSPGIYGYHDTQDGGQTGTVVVDGPPVAAATGPPTAKRGEPVTFDGSASSDPDGDAITSYQWTFGDGTTASGAQVQHAFTTAGHYDVVLTVSDSTGSGTTTVPIDITVPDSDGDGVNDDLDKCPNNPGPAPDGCPIVVPIKSSLVAARDLGLPGALRSGVTTILNCSGPCTAFFTLSRAGRSVASPVTARMAAAGTELVTVRFTSAARRSLGKLQSAKLQLQAVVTDAVTRVQTRKATVVLKRVKQLGKLPAIGISDNQVATFDDPNFRVLKLKYARLVTPWNSVFTEPARLDAWLQTARAYGIRPLVSFEHTRGQACPGRHCKGPSKAQFTRAWKAFHKKYSWVKDISPWNEVNSATQPTGKRPDLAATYYNVVRANCRGCTLVAADLLDASNIRRYVAAFLAKAKGKPRIWGLHNYTDTNRFRSRGTNALLQTVSGTVWLTETGGVVRFVTQSGKVALPKSESRAKKAMDYMFRLAETNASRIKRIYVYQWKVNNPFDRFDAGVVRPDGTPRPSFQVLSLNASIARTR